jgi:antitoxin component YwqK of YwqJK toxin-antitoxin module
MVSGKETGCFITIQASFCSRGYYINGKKNGEEITYYENGAILSKGEYKDDKRVLPTWKIYDENGKPIL